MLKKNEDIVFKYYYQTFILRHYRAKVSIEGLT